jgi:hypothetical protein
VNIHRACTAPARHEIPLKYRVNLHPVCAACPAQGSVGCPVNFHRT